MKPVHTKRPNYAFKRTAEQALRSIQTIAPQPLNAALGSKGELVAYMRGEPYIWTDGEKLHIWSKSGNDGWSDIEGLNGIAEASGVALDEQHADEFAVMRFAELVQEGKLQVTIERALQEWGSNFGASSLREIGSALVKACATLPSN